MRNRKEILLDLLSLRGEINHLSRELSNHPWDLENPILKVNKNDIIPILKKFIDGQISFETLTNWADALEVRDDIEFESEDLREVIFELANPKINLVTKEKVVEFIADLDNQPS